MQFDSGETGTQGKVVRPRRMIRVPARLQSVGKHCRTAIKQHSHCGVENSLYHTLHGLGRMLSHEGKPLPC